MLRIREAMAQVFVSFSSNYWLNFLIQTFFQDALILSAVQYLHNFGQTRKNLGFAS